MFHVKHRLGQRFFLDAELFCSLERAGETDDVNDTVDYVEVYNVIGDITCKRKYHLLEALAQDIASGLIGRFQMLEKVNIAVRKPHVPLNGILDHVEIVISRSRKKD